ncbi:MAG: hypothetical protein COX57_05275 [Alphaproteobacteria bacterium CG_4_10_14_0_2_um_filter_63_37]|nr:MAG: hypothetical protein AUJ55_11065 [Proteobacteria bacterium CG1_02_64_396]PJA25064.1 MAG: hypothetical protein COX57_05275 [Alphaproteobacteria bacterium CG_4_10_14_0_2_um_filter_63_37]
MDQHTGASREQIEQLCIDCGLCCDGTLFDVGRIYGDEDLALARSLGFSIGRRGEKTIFALPCRHFDRACTIHAAPRPHICGAFFCTPLRLLQRGAIALEQARAQLEQTVALQRRFARLCSLDPDLAGLPIAAVRKHLHAQGLDAEQQRALRQRHGELYLIGLKLFPLIDALMNRGPGRREGD